MTFTSIWDLTLVVRSSLIIVFSSWFIFTNPETSWDMNSSISLLDVVKLTSFLSSWSWRSTIVVLRVSYPITGL